VALVRLRRTYRRLVAALDLVEAELAREGRDGAPHPDAVTGIIAFLAEVRASGLTMTARALLARLARLGAVAPANAARMADRLDGVDRLGDEVGTIVDAMLAGAGSSPALEPPSPALEPLFRIYAATLRAHLALVGAELVPLAVGHLDRSHIDAIDRAPFDGPLSDSLLSDSHEMDGAPKDMA
jgi:hypothetical protein